MWLCLSIHASSSWNIFSICLWIHSFIWRTYQYNFKRLCRCKIHLSLILNSDFLSMSSKSCIKDLCFHRKPALYSVVNQIQSLECGCPPAARKTFKLSLTFFNETLPLVTKSSRALSWEPHYKMKMPALKNGNYSEPKKSALYEECSQVPCQKEHENFHTSNFLYHPNNRTQFIKIMKKQKKWLSVSVTDSMTMKDSS